MTVSTHVQAVFADNHANRKQGGFQDSGEVVTRASLRTDMRGLRSRRHELGDRSCLEGSALLVVLMVRDAAPSIRCYWSTTLTPS